VQPKGGPVELFTCDEAHGETPCRLCTREAGHRVSGEGHFLYNIPGHVEKKPLNKKGGGGNKWVNKGDA